MSWLPVVVTVPPEDEPVSLDDAKRQCRVDGSDDDTWLQQAIKRARTEAERVAGVKALTQTVVMRCSAWADLAQLPTAPIASIESITYLDPEGVERTLSTSVYEAILVGLEPHVRLKVGQSWPPILAATDAIRVTAVAGEDEADEAIVAAVLCSVDAWYDARTLGDLPTSAIGALTNYRRF